MADYAFTAVEEKNINRLTQLFSLRKADPNCFNAAGEPLLVVVVRMGFFQGLKTILSQPNANPNLKDRDGNTAMHVAAKKGDFIALRMLVENGGHKNVRDKEGSSPLHHAVQSGSYAIVNYLVNDPDRRHKHLCKININAVANDRSTPLLNACYTSDLCLVELFIKAGAKTDWRDAFGYTAKAIAMFKGWDGELEVKIPMDPYTDEFIKRKALAHCYGIGGQSEIGKTRFFLRGAYSPYIHRMVHWQLERFFQYADDLLSPTHKRAILEAFEHSIHKPRSPKIVDRVQKGSLTVMQSGWIRHSIVLVFFREYMAICNRGVGVPEGFSTTEVFKIDPKRVTKALIDKILEQESLECVHASSYFYFDLPIDVSPLYPQLSVQDSLCRAAARFAPNFAKEGTCTFTAAKAGLRVSLMLLKTALADPSSYQSIGRECREISKQASTFGRILMLEEYLQDHFSSSDDRLQAKGQIDLSLVRESYRRARKHVSAIEKDFRISFCFRLTNLRRNYPEAISAGR